MPEDNNQIQPQEVATPVQPVQIFTPPQVQQPMDLSSAQAMYPGAATYTYAGFWYRFAAYFIDGIIINIISSILSTLVLGSLIQTTLPTASETDTLRAGTFAAFGASVFGYYVFVVVAIVMYNALLESSSWQGSVGKKVFGIIVTDMNGQRVTLGKAVGRNFAKLLSSLILCIGYIMAGFTEKKQALHDIIAGTLVLKKVG